MRRQHALVIRREDHKHDALGAIFLGAVEDPVEVRSYLERYLGPAVTVRGVELDEAVLRISVESSGFEVESQNLVRIGRSLAGKGRQRSAGDMFEEALRLDPLNVDALKADAAMKAAQGDLALAQERWVRAGEIRGYDGEILRGLAAIALQGERRPSAVRYLEEALIVNPDDAESRDLLAELRRQAELAFDIPRPGSTGRKDRG
ncbi:MAG: tetratricopeptide repeat protein [Candidatus Binatia bacterium]